METIKRLYGVSKSIWGDLPYTQALAFKNTLANHVISAIHAKNYKDVTNDDTIRINECVRAIKHNEGLINE